jgi:arylsulfatase A-like enzyme
VLIVADDQRHDTIAALGNRHIHTPNLDALVHDGFTFTNGRCMGAQQGAVCVPTRAGIHTGRMLYNVPDNMGDHATIGQTLRGAGYTAGGHGKWHNQGPAFARSFDAGGNIFFGGMDTDQFNVPVSAFSPDGRYPGKTTVTPGKFSSELYADAAIDFIRRQAGGEKPFFCYLAFTSPHDPRTPPPEFRALYDPASMPLPANFLPRHPFDNGELVNRDENLAPFPRTEADTRRQLCDYYGMISAQDAQVGRVRAALRETGQADNTIVIYTGDHGLAIGSHGLFGKQNVYEHSARIPMIVVGPTVPAGRTSDAIAYSFDLFPTLCGLTGIDTPGSVQGKSLAGILGGTAASVRDSSFHAYINHANGRPARTQHAVYDGRWKLIRYRVAGPDQHQLYDLSSDPDELHDLSTDGTAAREIPRLAVLLARWQRDVGERPAWG